MTTPDPSLCRNPDCGKPRKPRRGRHSSLEGSNGWCGACTRRWRAHGKPASGPPPPMSARQAASLGGTVSAQAREDTYELTWMAARPERRIRNAAPFASDLARCVGARDAEGVRRLLYRFNASAQWEDWAALAIVLAEGGAAGDGQMREVS